jgi:large subunit ribosomal protein L24
MKIRKDDIVEVITGKDKGKQGKVLEVLPSRNRVRVEGVMLVKKHQKPRQMERSELLLRSHLQFIFLMLHL